MSDEIVAKHNLNAAQYTILELLSEQGPLKQTQIAQFLSVTPANISQMIAKMERANWVKRVAKGASKVVELTPRSVELIAKLNPEMRSFMGSRFDTLNAAELNALDVVVDKLLRDHGVDATAV